MINTYLIIILIIIVTVHLLVFYLKDSKLKSLGLNNKLVTKNLTKTDFFSINSLIKNNNLYKILIVEDDKANREILKAQLTAAKYNVIIATNGESALKIINKVKNIDIVLLDIMLPDISGFDVCKKIRHQFTLYEKPIIMVTSKNYIKDLIEGFEAGANDFITKPYNIYELITRINSSISLKNIFEDNSSLKKINKLKSEIVDMAVHDLKSPLTIISGYSKRIIKVVNQNSSESKNANKILNSANKMLTIIDKLLNESKYDNMILEFKELNIASLLYKSIEFHEDLANEKKQKLNYVCCNKNISAYIDRNSIEAIFDNLISNAIKYSPLSSNIYIELKENNEQIVISIKDSGNGFTQEEIDNLFIKYFPFSNKPTQGENSTGLGLFIINDLVTRNNGTITVHSIKGQGSQFNISFKRV